MKIGMIGGRGLPSTYSGVEVFMKEVCPRLVERGHDVTVFCNSNNFETNSYMGVRLVSVPALKSKRLGTMTRSLMSCLYSLYEHLDIWHFNAIGPAALAWIPKIGRCPSVATIHSLNWKHSKWNAWEKAAIKSIEKIAVKAPDALVTVSKQHKAYFQKSYGRPVVFVPNGVNIKPPVRPAKIVNYGLGNLPFVLFVGRLSPEKGVHHLLAAYRGVETDCKLVIAGGYAGGEDYFRYLKSLADDRVLFLGHLPADVLSELYSNASVYVLPSESEGLSISLLEAMGYGCCVVVSGIQENLDVVSDGGVSFEAGNPQELRDTLNYLVRAPAARKALGQKALALASNYYRWDDICSRYEAIYESVGRKKDVSRMQGRTSVRKTLKSSIEQST